ncbi:hypothetical protein F5Y19DRAFT_487136 [Xylariaceae sp. FL1651]|nr:hypothetical protein F5Y19DRAFT_487136 [Xylariaceae sp. FL1651]
MSGQKKNSRNSRNLSENWPRRAPGHVAAAAPTPPVAPTTPAHTRSPTCTDPNRNYRGDLSNPRNLSDDIPDEANCSTFWTGLPGDCSFKNLFDSMRNIGRISHAHISKPAGQYKTAAAKVEFFERESVDKLMAEARAGNVRVAGVIPTITLNRVRIAALGDHTDDHRVAQHGIPSRVLQVIGPRQVVVRETLEAILAAQNLEYGLEEVVHVLSAEGNRCLEFRFASYRAQAARARFLIIDQRRNQALTPEERALWRKVAILWGPDPCA